jgi:Skp family chaperone for outer membrane proteins
MSNAVAIVELVASASDSLDERPEKNCFGCADERTVYTRIWQGFAATTLAVNLAAIIIEESAVMIVAGTIACCVAVVVIVLQFKIQDTDTLRMVQNALRKEVNRLNEENKKLATEVKELDVQVQRVQEEESKLETITKQQGINSETFLQLISENRSTLVELKVSMQHTTLTFVDLAFLTCFSSFLMNRVL